SSKFFKYLNLYAAFILTDGKEYIENFPEILEFYNEKTIPYGIAEFVQIQTLYVEYFEKLNMKKEFLDQLKDVNELFLQIFLNETFTPQEFKPFFSYYFGNFKKYYYCNQDDKTFFLDNINILNYYLENFLEEPDQEYEEVQKIVASI
ncbi:MAG: hypothetical protein J0647_00790, partial [Campylobacteraceae bacterium]|nr:hypothetical protein [Campylobacteraceae bacterium]